LEDAVHRRVEDGGKFHEGILEEQGNIRIIFDLFLNGLDVVSENHPNPRDIGNDIDGGEM
jgi:hypothetical protein